MRDSLPDIEKLLKRCHPAPPPVELCGRVAEDLASDASWAGIPVRAFPRWLVACTWMGVGGVMAFGFSIWLHQGTLSPWYQQAQAKPAAPASPRFSAEDIWIPGEEVQVQNPLQTEDRVLPAGHQPKTD